MVEKLSWLDYNEPVFLPGCFVLVMITTLLARVAGPVLLLFGVGWLPSGWAPTVPPA